MTKARAQLSIRLLGRMTIKRGEDEVALPNSQKTRALLAYLAVTGRAVSRERLCSMFWDVTDDPRGALRWSLSKLRTLDDRGATRIDADRQSVSFEAHGAYVDALDVRAALAKGLDDASVERLRELTGAFRGGFLDGVDLADFDEFRAWRVAEREYFRGAHASILSALVARLASEPEEALGYARELVRLGPEDEASRAALVRLLVAAGRREEAEEHYTLGRRQIERVGKDRGELREAWTRAPVDQAPRSAPAADGAARQQIKMCTSRDGVRIAYATVGEGPPLVKTANWMSHLEYDWKSPLWRHVARELSRDFRLVRYDQRANGLSDRDAQDLSVEAFTNDLEAVVDAAGLDRFALLGVSQGCRAAIAFAARSPERVSHLVLYGGSARGFRKRPAGARAARAGLQALIREGWGRENPAFRQVFTTLFMPGAAPEQAAWFNELQRVSSTPEDAYRLTEAYADADVTDLLAKVQAPTLVMHANEDAMIPFDESRLLAAEIPGARLVALDSQNHLLLDDEPAFARFLSEIRYFLAS